MPHLASVFVRFGNIFSISKAIHSNPFSLNLLNIRMTNPTILFLRWGRRGGEMDNRFTTYPDTSTERVYIPPTPGPTLVFLLSGRGS